MNRFFSHSLGAQRLVRCAVIAAVLGAGWLVGQGEAQAQMTAQQKQEMRQHYEKATRAYDVGKYPEAIEEYQKAYEIGGDPPMLYNIAQAYRLSDQPAEAVRFYRRYLQRQPSAKNRDDVERRIAELEKVSEERRKAAPAPQQPPPPPPPAPPPPAALEPLATPPVAPLVTNPASPPGDQPPPPAPRSRVRQIVGWSLVGASAVLLGAGGYEAWVAKDKADKVSSQSQQDPPKVFDPAVEQNGKDASLRAIVLGGVGVAALAAGVIVLVTGRPAAAEGGAPVARAARPPSLGPWLAGGAVGAGAGFQF